MRDHAVAGDATPLGGHPHFGASERRIGVIINFVRRNRFTTTAAAIMILSACSSTPDEPSFNPTPRPTRPGQVVIIAGDHNINRDPRDGEYALQTSAYTNGGLAAAGDGRIMFEVVHGREGRIARLEHNGRITLLKLGNVPSQLAVHGNDLWLMSAYSGFDLTKASLATLGQEVQLAWDSALGEKLSVVTDSGRPASKTKREEIAESLQDARFNLRADGTPIIARKDGELFEVPEIGTIRRWHPEGYDKALAKVSAGTTFDTTYVASDSRTGEMAILGHQGIIWIPRTGAASGLRFPQSARSLPPWTVAAQLGDGSTLLLGGVNATHRTPRPVRASKDKGLTLLSWGEARRCDEFDGSLATIGSAFPGGIARLPDGSLVISDKMCGRVYSFRMPDDPAGRPYPA
ncbi:hypothetical protein Acsp04_50160 [Actinomadura sp. NBRC 104425]|uniref:hypothetical protein n=1 Tax=Actinomadura sp. NBRC 104425 TaxID=3032204 RepID=UPI0024A3828D|nr:hypothetical protein [Actinomadura sp. NBRC 104425]GLZ14781.1 hypothetical protein Acsp04_50160 [Actinomadura sp. NBRC 104425]